jgi:two-component system sensor histidine kinase YesM
MNLQKRSSIMVKMVAVFFLALLPIALLYFTTYNMSRKLLTDEVISSILRQNKVFSDRLSDDLQRILYTNRILTTNWELGKLAVVPDDFTLFEQSVAISNIQDKIFLAQLTSRFIESINVYIPSIDKRISTNPAGSLEHMRQLAKEIEHIQCDRFFVRDGKIVFITQNTFNPNDGSAFLIETVLSSSSTNYMIRQLSDDISHGVLFNLDDLSVISESNPTDRIAKRIVHMVADVLQDKRGSAEVGTIDLQIDNTTYKAFYTYFGHSDLVLTRYFSPQDIDVKFGYMQQLMTFSVILFSIAFLMLHISLNRIVSSPLRQLMKSFEQIIQGDLNVSIDTQNNSEFKTIYENFNRMVSRINELHEQNYQQTIYLQQAELKQLQAQIDPHFLYNSFFILNKRIRAGDSQGAISFSNMIAEYYQYVTYNTHNTMPLINEIEHAYNYAKIQQVRFANRLILKLESVPDEYRDILVPRLILQPIIENVFRHVINIDYSPIELHVSYETQLNSISIHIENSGGMLTDGVISDLSQKLEGRNNDNKISGLVNVHKRLRLYCGEGYGVTVKRSRLGGLHVTLKVRAGVGCIK